MWTIIDSLVEHRKHAGLTPSVPFCMQKQNVAPPQAAKWPYICGSLKMWETTVK